MASSFDLSVTGWGVPVNQVLLLAPPINRVGVRMGMDVSRTVSQGAGCLWMVRHRSVLKAHSLPYIDRRPSARRCFLGEYVVTGHVVPVSISFIDSVDVLLLRLTTPPISLLCHRALLSTKEAPYSESGGFLTKVNLWPTVGLSSKQPNRPAIRKPVVAPTTAGFCFLTFLGSCQRLLVSRAFNATMGCGLSQV